MEKEKGQAGSGSGPLLKRWMDRREGEREWVNGGGERFPWWPGQDPPLSPPFPTQQQLQLRKKKRENQEEQYVLIETDGHLSTAKFVTQENNPQRNQAEYLHASNGE